MERELGIAGAFLAAGAVIWLVFLRPVPVETARGVIRGKTFQAGGEYLQYQPGNRQGFRSPTKITMAEHYVLAIEVPGRDDTFRYAVNTAMAPSFDVGQVVEIEYQRRGVPPFWRRIYVLDARRVD